MDKKKEEELLKAPNPYVSKNQQQMDQLSTQMNDRKFTWNPDSDAKYQQAIDDYKNMGKAAMQDTVGQLSALTGGYGNSYAQTAGQQAYQGYLTKAAGLAPQYEAMAMDQYRQQGDELMRQYQMLANKERDEYGRYQDNLSRYMQQQQWQHQLDREALADQKDYYNHALMLIQAGHKLTPEQLEQAGMSEKEYKRWRRNFKGGGESYGSPVYVGGSGGGGEETGGDGGWVHKDIYDAMLQNGTPDFVIDSFLRDEVKEGYLDQKDEGGYQRVPINADLTNKVNSGQMTPQQAVAEAQRRKQQGR